MTPPPAQKIIWQPRLARETDIPALETLIPLSVRALHTSHYTSAEIEAAIGPIYGVDRYLIRDGTYFVVEHDGQMIGCGGWSKRRSLYGSDSHRTVPDPELDPQHDAARVRAFFVHPGWVRCGIGRAIMESCERAIIIAGFRKVEISATLPGELLYASFGYSTVEHYTIPMTNGLQLPVVKMTKEFSSSTCVHQNAP